MKYDRRLQKHWEGKRVPFPSLQQQLVFFWRYFLWRSLATRNIGVPLCVK